MEAEKIQFERPSRGGEEKAARKRKTHWRRASEVGDDRKRTASVTEEQKESVVVRTRSASDTHGLRRKSVGNLRELIGLDSERRGRKDSDTEREFKSPHTLFGLRKDSKTSSRASAPELEEQRHTLALGPFAKKKRSMPPPIKGVTEKTTLEDVLLDEFFYESFEIYLSGFAAEENLAFLLGVSTLKTGTDNGDRWRIAEHIFRTFVSSSAELPINISYTQQKRVEGLFQTLVDQRDTNPDFFEDFKGILGDDSNLDDLMFMFGDLKREIEKLLKDEYFPNWLHYNLPSREL